MPQIPQLHLGDILDFYLGVMGTHLVSGWGFVTFSNSREEEAPYCDQILPPTCPL